MKDEIPYQNTFLQEISEESVNTPSSYHISVAIGGRCVELKRKLGKAPERLTEVKREKIQTYSRQSRNRFLKFLLTIDYSKMGNPVFYTLTYPGEYSADPAEWKRDLNLFFVRMRKQYPGMCATWRLEPQKRGAPHFSGFLFGADDLKTMEGKRKFSQLWYEVVGSGDEKHLRAGTGVGNDFDRREKIYYMAKYQSKDEKGGKMEFFDYPVGRYWGVIGKAHFQTRVEEMEIPSAIYFKIRRVLRKRLEKKTTKKKYREIIKGSGQGLWLEMSEESILKLLSYLIEEEERLPLPEVRKFTADEMTDEEEWRQAHIWRRYERNQRKRVKKGGGEARRTCDENEMVWMMRR